jgi:hypothetical protein
MDRFENQRRRQAAQGQMARIRVARTSAAGVPARRRWLLSSSAIDCQVTGDASVWRSLDGSSYQQEDDAERNQGEAGPIPF